MIQRISLPSQFLSLSGPDARDFLNRITSADARNLHPGEATRGMILTPQGKLRAIFTLYCESSDRFLLRAPEAKNTNWAEALTQAIDQFTFAEKMKLEPVTPVYVDLLSESPIPGAFTLSGDDYGIPLSTIIGADAAAYSKTETLSTSQLEEKRILAVRPAVDHEIAPDAQPLELGLKDYIASNKGCYPGQEVIEKIISLGSPAKRLCLLEQVSGAEPTHHSSALTANGDAAGQMTSRFGKHALAILRKNHIQIGTTLNAADSSGATYRVVKQSAYADE